MYERKKQRKNVRKKKSVYVREKVYPYALER